MKKRLFLAMVALVALTASADLNLQFHYDMGKEIYKRVTDNLKMWLRERYDVEVE
jgi:hypothetical protein